MDQPQPTWTIADHMTISDLEALAHATGHASVADLLEETDTTK